MARTDRPCRRLAVVGSIGVMAALSGCPARRPPPPSGPPPAPVTREWTTVAEQRSDPVIGTPPFEVAVLPARAGDEAPIDSEEIRRVLARNLALGGKFLIARAPEEPRGQALHTVIEVGASRDRGQITARAALYFPASTGDEPAQTIVFEGRGHHALARRLASAIHQYHLRQPGLYLSRIAFVAGTAADPGARHVFVVGFDGEQVQRISQQGRQNILPTWSPRDDLLFTSYARGNPDLIIVARGQTTGRPLSTRVGLNVGAAVSPDGSAIALTLSEGGNTDIYLLAPDGTMLRRLTDHPSIDVSPGWSPDGSEIAFVSGRGGSPQVYAMPATGGEPRLLTQSGNYNQEPEWCPKKGSSTIAYTRRYPGERYEVHLVDAVSGEDRRLTQDGGVNKSPSWAPDCSLIVFAAGQTGLVLITPDGRQQRRLYRGRALTPAWSRQ